MSVEKTSDDKPRVKFGMKTDVFCIIWKNHLTSPDSDDWNKFVQALFSRFKDHGENHEAIAKWAAYKKLGKKKWTEDQIHEFLSERAYSKAITVKRKLKKDADFDIDLPEGYKNRNGAKSKRISTSDLAAIFRS